MRLSVLNGLVPKGTESKWRANLYQEGLLNGPWLLAASILESDYEGWFLTDQRPNAAQAVLVQFPGPGVITSMLAPKPGPATSFPYGFTVEPDH